MRVVGINGIATHGEGNTDVLLSRLSERGFKTVDVALPRRHFVSAWWGHLADADAIYNATQDGDAVVAHSFGCPRVAEVLKFQRKFKYLFLIRPAMDKHYTFVKRSGIYCFHSPDDWPVRVGSWLPWHPFGRAGVDGFTDMAVTNIETEGGHNADFTRNLHQTVEIISRVLTTGSM